MCVLLLLVKKFSFTLVRFRPIHAKHELSTSKYFNLNYCCISESFLWDYFMIFLPFHNPIIKNIKEYKVGPRCQKA